MTMTKSICSKSLAKSKYEMANQVFHSRDSYQSKNCLTPMHPCCSSNEGGRLSKLISNLYGPIS